MYNTMLSQLIALIHSNKCGTDFSEDGTGKFGVHRITQEAHIIIPLGASEIQSLIATAHEYGHFQQFCHWDKDKEVWENVLRDTPRLILEHDAWDRSVVILYELGFTAWDEFIKEANRCISTYYVAEYSLCEVIDHMHIFALRMRRQIDSVKEVKYA